MLVTVPRPTAWSHEPSYLLFPLDLGIVEGDGLGALGQHVLLQLAELVLVVFSLGAQLKVVLQPGLSGHALPGPVVGRRAAPGWAGNCPRGSSHAQTLSASLITDAL